MRVENKIDKLIRVYLDIFLNLQVLNVLYFEGRELSTFLIKGFNKNFEKSVKINNNIKKHLIKFLKPRTAILMQNILGKNNQK